VDTGQAWVAAGAPLTPEDRLGSAARAFVAAARAADRRACFFGAESRFVCASPKLFSALRIGEQPVWDPQRWPGKLQAHASLREQVRRAHNKQVRVREVSADELVRGHTRLDVDQVRRRWYARRKLAPFEFLVRVDPIRLAEHSRGFVAEVQGRLVGFASALPVPAREGWFLADLLRDPSAPNGTSEALVDFAMRQLALTRCEWLTLGLAPLAGEVAAPLRFARNRARALYDFEGLRAFKAKLRPDSWASIYLLYPTQQGPTRSVFDALTAFTGDGWLRFGLHSALHRAACPLSASRL
jgi:phosphatidylglycerol lysyltransferase